MKTTKHLFELDGKVALITGSSKGIGLALAEVLAEYGAKVVVSSRSQDSVDEVAKNLRAKGHTVMAQACHVGDSEQRKILVNKTIETYGGIDILINNAAMMACPEMPTKEGWDLQFAVNHIGHFILTKGLLPALSQSENARVVALSSTAHKMSGIRWDDIHFKDSYDKWQSYGQSKTAASLLAVELDSRMKEKGIRAFGVHPGGIFTPLQRHLEKEEKE